MIFDTDNKKVNVGLSLKYEGKGLKTLGYTRKVYKYWEYSDLAINLIRDYMKKFSELFNTLMHYKGSNIPKVTELFKNKTEDEISEVVRDIKNYLLNKKEGLSQVTLNSDSLSKFSIRKLEEQIIDYVQIPRPVEQINVKNIPRFAVLNPAIPILKLKQQEFRLGDRVIYVLNSGKVPVFSKGTVVGYRSSETAVSVHVIFDLPLLTGNSFDGRLITQRGLSVDSSALLNITLKQYMYQSKGRPPINKNQASTNLKKQVSTKKNTEKTELERKEVERERKLKQESTKELLSLISGNKSAKTEEKIEESSTEPISITTKTTVTNATNNVAAKKIMEMLVSGSGNPAASASSVPLQPPMNGFPMPFPPINGGGFIPQMMPFPMPMLPNPMYPYAAQEPQEPQVPQVQQNGTASSVNLDDSKKVFDILKKNQTSNKNEGHGGNQRGHQRGHSRGGQRGSRGNRGGHKGNFKGHGKETKDPIKVNGA